MMINDKLRNIYKVEWLLNLVFEKPSGMRICGAYEIKAAHMMLANMIKSQIKTNLRFSFKYPLQHSIINRFYIRLITS